MVTFTIKIVDEGLMEIHASRPGYPGSSLEMEIHPDEQEWLLKMGASSLLEDADD